MSAVGLDIGGANLKVSDGEHISRSRSFALWKSPEKLAGTLNELLKDFPECKALAVTMTGELADCFESKSEGVIKILEAVESIAGPRPVFVWHTGGEFLSPAEARDLVPLVSAANWHALATWAGRIHPDGPALLIDMGSTTTDLTPLESGLPMPVGRTDLERLLSGELVYLGVRRTPVCAVAETVPLRGDVCPLAAEFFAEVRDLFLITGDCPDDPDCFETPDGRPATREAAQNRLAHMLCCDTTELRQEEIELIARYCLGRIEHRLEEALDRVMDRFCQDVPTVLLAGEGEFFVRRLVEKSARFRQATLFSLAEMIGAGPSQSACAFALARLLSERSY